MHRTHVNKNWLCASHAAAAKLAAQILARCGQELQTIFNNLIARCQEYLRIKS
jgi:hypothetical protein